HVGGVDYGGRRAILASARDITERKEAERRLEAGEQRYKSLFEHNPDAVYSFDLEGRFLSANPACERLTGYAAEELSRMSFVPFIVPEDLSRTMRHFEGAAAGEPQNYEIAITHKDGRRVELDVTNLPVVVGGEVVGVYGIAKDVTERKEAERALEESRRWLAEAQKVARLGVWEWNVGSGKVAWSEEQCRIYGLEPHEFAGTVEAHFERVHPDDRGTVRGSRERTLRLAGPVELENRITRPDGEVRVVHTHRQTVRDERGEPIKVFGTTQDVTERRRAEEALRESQARLAEAQRIARVGSWEYAVGEDEAHWSDEMYRIFGRDPGSFVPTYGTFLRSVHPDDRRSLLRMFRKALREGKHYGHSAGFRVVRPDGKVRAVHARYEVIREDEAGRPTKISGTLQDVTERKALEERLEHQAFHDPLTGLPNRALFVDRLRRAMAQAARRESDGEGTVAVLFVDLDNFKLVNDSLGHEVGDELLVAVAERLLPCLRSSDTAARLGGDEFVMLLEDVADEDEAAAIAGRLADAFEAPLSVGGRELFVSLSIGMACGASSREGPEALLRAADAAMYRAKEKGKARLEVSAPIADALPSKRLDLYTDLRGATERGEFELFYQPKVLIGDGSVARLEALLRWRHPTRGLLEPSDFVPLAEETGLIAPIGRWVLEEACRRAKEWQERCPSDPPLEVCVNVSASQFRQPQLVEEVARALRYGGLDPASLVLEVTESGLVVRDDEPDAGILGELKELGVKLYIDDFGTGYSSLSYLKRLPVDSLKLDGSFVSGLGADPHDEAIVASVVSLAHALGMRVVAEGVETAEQLACLAKLGCDFAQGHHLSPPLPREAVGPLLAGRPEVRPPADDG
ncbi:MAG: EAL domain-containing protein, partial [Actinomycetota bacterium]|nr:EAL domain-containing protein [Actinomycetota bacterium]